MFGEGEKNKEECMIKKGRRRNERECMREGRKKEEEWMNKKTERGRGEGK